MSGPTTGTEVTPLLPAANQAADQAHPPCRN